uniref:hypothetical protein n=1 Tax=Burkholderia ubonensis TaxID=101571 RepID=UPI000AB30692|nr:hypothetical protein [Burkholderia ubonensis]
MCLLATIQATVSDAQLVRADAVLSTQHGTSGMTVLEWLKTPPARHSPSTITETLLKVRFLKSLGAHTWNLDAVPIEKQRAYAQRIQVRRPAKVRELKVSTRTIALIFFLHVALLELTDALLYQTGRRVSDLVRHAYDRTTVKQARSAVEYRQQLISIKALVEDANHSAEERLIEIGKLLEDLSDKPPTSHAASVRETLTDDHHRIRNLLVPMRELQLSGREAESSLRQLELLSTLHDRGATELPADCEVPISASWRDLVEDEDRVRAMRALEASAITGLRRGLRRGSVWVSHSLSFRARDQLLIPPAQWEHERDPHLSSLDLPHKAEPFLARLTKHMKAGLSALDLARSRRCPPTASRGARAT